MYGAVVGSATAVSVDVAEAGSTYTVEAQIVDRRATNLTWKAFLRPHAEYGGNVTLTARPNASWSLLRTLLTLHINPGSLYRCDKSD